MRHNISKEVIIALIVLFSISLFLSGCKKEPCPENQIRLDDVCCYDLNYNFLCDADEGIAICGDGTCEKDENCSNCNSDCGLCKIVNIVYYPTNFTMKNFTTELNTQYSDKITFRRDTDAKDDVFKFYFDESKAPRLTAEVLGKKMNSLMFSRRLVVTKTDLPYWYLNSSSDLMTWVNHSRWYYINDKVIESRRNYAVRIQDDVAKEDYPISPSGKDRYHRYADWYAKNFTITEDVIADNTSLVDDDFVWSVFAVISGYEIKYQNNVYEDLDKDTGEKRMVYGYKNITELKLDYINTVTFECSRNMALTLFDYTYDFEHYTLTPERLAIEVENGKKGLLTKAKRLKGLCEKKYSTSVFTP